MLKPQGALSELLKNPIHLIIPVRNMWKLILNYIT